VKNTSFDRDFEGMFRDLEILDRRLMETFQKELDTILEGIKGGKMKGDWRVREINVPNIRGFIIQGRFGSEDTLEPLGPLRPNRPRPLPENPFQLPKKAVEETREPLTDFFDEKDAIRICVELLGEEEDNIRLDAKEGQIEIKARSFYKKIALPRASLELAAMSSTYKNGVLQVTIPKKAKIRPQDSLNTRMV